jgi:hypothetical protein
MELKQYLRVLALFGLLAFVGCAGLRESLTEGAAAARDSAVVAIREDPTPFASVGDLITYVLAGLTAGIAAGYGAYQRGKVVGAR